MAKRSPARPQSSLKDQAFPFRAPAPTGAMLTDEAAAFSTDMHVDPQTGRRSLVGARSAASLRMHTKAGMPRTSTRRQALALPDEEEMNALGEADEPELPQHRLLESEPELSLESDDQSSIEQEVERRVAEKLAQVQQHMAATHAHEFTLQEMPQPLSAPTPAAQPRIGLRPLAVEDVDRLWDWLRADADGGAAFFGRTFKHSMELHQMMVQLGQAEAHSVGLLRALYYEADEAASQHLGFVALAPILSTEKVAVLHVYLRPDVRGQLPTLASHIVENATRLLPSYQLAVLALGAHARLYRQMLTPLGFAEHVIFVRQ